jgi:hypothetical protein
MTTRRKRRSEFRTTTRCPICGAAGCLVCGPRKSPVAVICRRTISPNPVGSVGFLHMIDHGGSVFAWTPAGREVARIARGID